MIVFIFTVCVSVPRVCVLFSENKRCLCVLVISELNHPYLHYDLNFESVNHRRLNTVPEVRGTFLMSYEIYNPDSHQLILHDGHSLSNSTSPNELSLIHI